MYLEKIGARSWRLHGVPTIDWFSVEGKATLEAGGYLLSGEVSDPQGMSGGYVQISGLPSGYVQLTPGGLKSVRFDVADTVSVSCSLNCRYKGNPVDLTAKRLSLVKIG